MAPKSFVFAGKAYGTNALRSYIEKKGGIAVIRTTWANRKNPPEYYLEIGKLRHWVEILFAKIERYRRIATRYAKLLATYIGFVELYTAIEWIKFHCGHTA